MYYPFYNNPFYYPTRAYTNNMCSSNHVYETYTNEQITNETINNINSNEQLKNNVFSIDNDRVELFGISINIDDLINGFVPNIYFEGKDVYYEILNNDVYYVTKDLPMYLNSLQHIDEDWRNQDLWYSKVITNIAQSGFFDNIRLIEDYCEKVWMI